MTASPKTGGAYAYENDVLGNRTWRDRYVNGSTSARYTWDEAGRLFSYCTTSSGAKYVYRADGMRAEKIEGLSLNWVPNESKDDETSSGYYDAVWASNKPTTRYFYDGQMPMGEDYTNSSTYTRTKYGVGARGIDLIEYNDGSSTTYGFPLYDAHGNQVTTLYRSGSSFTKDSMKYYDAWGTPTSSSGWFQQYCANLGHRRDAESGLVYMRARYYEPWTGRFVSEDRQRDRTNWFVYCQNNPVSYVDQNGKESLDPVEAFMRGLIKVCEFFGFEPPLLLQSAALIMATALYVYNLQLAAGATDLFSRVCYSFAGTTATGVLSMFGPGFLVAGAIGVAASIMLRLAMVLAIRDMVLEIGVMEGYGN